MAQKMQAVRPSGQRAPGVQQAQPPKHLYTYRLVPVEVDIATGLARVEPGETLFMLAPEPSVTGVGHASAFAEPSPRSASGPVAQTLVARFDAGLAPSPGAQGLSGAFAATNSRSAFGPVASAPQLVHAAHTDPWLAVGWPALAEQAGNAGPALHGRADGLGHQQHSISHGPVAPQLDFAADMLARNGALAAANSIVVWPHASARFAGGAVSRYMDAVEPTRRAGVLPASGTRPLGRAPLTLGGSMPLSREATQCHGRGGRADASSKSGSNARADPTRRKPALTADQVLGAARALFKVLCSRSAGSVQKSICVLVERHPCARGFCRTSFHLPLVGARLIRKMHVCALGNRQKPSMGRSQLLVDGGRKAPSWHSATAWTRRLSAIFGESVLLLLWFLVTSWRHACATARARAKEEVRRWGGFWCWRTRDRAERERSSSGQACALPACTITQRRAVSMLDHDPPPGNVRALTRKRLGAVLAIRLAM